MDQTSSIGRPKIQGLICGGLTGFTSQPQIAPRFAAPKFGGRGEGFFTHAMLQTLHFSGLGAEAAWLASEMSGVSIWG